MESIMDSRYAILQRQLDRFAMSGEACDHRRYIAFLMVDNLGELAFNQPFGDQEAEDPAKIPPVSEAPYSACVPGQIPSAKDIFSFKRPLANPAGPESLRRSGANHPSSLGEHTAASGEQGREER